MLGCDTMAGSDNIREFLITKIKVEKKITQTQLALELGISNAAVSKWLNGLSNASLDQIIPICKIFDVTPNDLFNYGNKNKPNDSFNNGNKDNFCYRNYKNALDSIDIDRAFKVREYKALQIVVDNFKPNNDK